MPRSAASPRPMAPARAMSRPSASSVSAAPALDEAARLPCLATGTPRGGDDQADRGRDVERVVAVAAGAADVDRAGRGVDRDQAFAQRPRGLGDLDAGLAAERQRDQEVGDRFLAGAAVEDVGERLRRAFVRQRRRRVGEEGERGHAAPLVRMPASVRKLASSAWPCSVAMLSGWNWTPWIGSSRWRRPITDAVGRGRVDDQAVGHVGRRSGVIAGRGEGRGQAGEHAGAVMGRSRWSCRASARRAPPGRRNAGRSPDGPGTRRAAACRASAQAATRSRLIPASLGVHGPGEIRIAVGAGRQRVGRRQRVVALDPHLGAQLHQVMDQVPGEAVVIVDDQDGGGVTGSAIARARPRATVSHLADTLRASIRCRPERSILAC